MIRELKRACSPGLEMDGAKNVCEDLIFKHIGMFCNNTSAVVWAYIGGTSKSIPAG